ncbi:hypothetical protein HDU83_008409 [Entophlyctis luteolus]|nr:hypothetical protein HDU83_008409 [Entophlyctis luteolus]
MKQLTDPSLRSRLKKRPDPVAAPRPVESPAATSLQQPDETQQRQELFVELLQYMEAPNGNVEDLMEKTKTATNTCRAFIYTLIRKRWVLGHRIISDANGASVAPITVWPGREWMVAIEIPNIKEEDAVALETSGAAVGRVVLYRFDTVLRKHLLDVIVLAKSPNFPTEIGTFNAPEPPKDNSLESRKQWEEWNLAKLAYEQSDYPQFMLTYQKLKQTNTILVNTFNSLQLTLEEMRGMGTLLHEIFDGVSIPDLRKIVESIPARIKDVAKTLQKTTGIIIQDAGLKLTPEFLKQMNLNTVTTLRVQQEPVPPLSDSKETTPSTPGLPASNPPTPRTPETPQTPEPLPSAGDSLKMGGVPVNLLIPMLKKQMSTEEREARRRTYNI